MGDTYEIAIGKSGMTSSVVAEIARQLKARKHLQVRFHRSYAASRDREQIHAEFSELTRLLEDELDQSVGQARVVGNTCRYSL